MSFPSSALLVHSPGADRDAIADRLRSAGLAVRTRDDGRGLAADLRATGPETCVIARAADFRSATTEDRAALEGREAVVIVGAEPAPEGFARVVREPYFVDDLLPRASAAPVDPPLPAALVRGLAHALSNRVQAIAGCLSLLELPSSGGRAAAREEALRRARLETDLCGRVAQAMAALAGRGFAAEGRSADAASSLGAEVERRGLALRCEGAATVPCDPEELALTAALLLSDHDPQAHGGVVVVAATPGRVRIELPAPADLLDGAERPAGAGLANVRRTSSLGLALARRLAQRIGGDVDAGRGPDGRPRVVLSLPVVRAAESAR